MTSGNDSYGRLLDQIVAAYAEGMKDLSVENRNQRTLQMYWTIGRHIVEVEQDGSARAKYGTRLMERLSADLTGRLGQGFSRAQISYMRQFCNEYEIIHTCGKLTWSHYRALMTVKSRAARALLEQRAIAEALSWNSVAALAKAANEGADPERMARMNAAQTLVPRKGRTGLVKVVRITEGARTRPVLDCGFHVLAALPARRPGTLETGAIVAVTGKGTDTAVKTITCAAGEQYCYDGFVQRVVDGDTLEVLLYLSLGHSTLQRLRLRGVDAAEAGTPDGDRCSRRLARILPAGTRVKVLTYGWDTHGRWVADILLDNGTRFLNPEMKNI